MVRCIPATPTSSKHNYKLSHVLGRTLVNVQAVPSPIVFSVSLRFYCSFSQTCSTVATANLTTMGLPNKHKQPADTRVPKKLKKPVNVFEKQQHRLFNNFITMRRKRERRLIKKAHELHHLGDTEVFLVTLYNKQLYVYSTQPRNRLWPPPLLDMVRHTCKSPFQTAPD